MRRARSSSRGGEEAGREETAAREKSMLERREKSGARGGEEAGCEGLGVAACAGEEHA